MKESLRVLLTTVALLVSASANAQQVPDPRVADLIRAGKLRVALFLPAYVKDPVTGEIRGRGTGTITVQIAQTLAARLGVEVQLLGYPTPSAVAECLKAGSCDISFTAFNLFGTAEIGYSPPLFILPFTLLVPAGSPIGSVADADRPGVRIAVVSGHESTRALSRTVRHAELLGAEIPDAAFELLRTRQANAFASHILVLQDYSTKLPGSRVLEDRYGANLAAIAISKDKAGWLAYVSEFVEEAKASGLVQRAIERAGMRGIRVAPPGNPKPSGRS